MLKNILTSAVFAGASVGVIAALLQFWLVTPALMEGELFETGARVHFSSDGTTQSEAGHGSIWTEPSRHLMTVGFNIVTHTAFAFFLVAGFAMAERAGHKVTEKQGFVWGLCAFIALQLAPAVGLPPELPGTPAAEVQLRQVWWLACVVCSIVGLGFIAFGANLMAIASGLVLLALPHVIGAPHLDTYFGVAPPELSAHFVGLSLGSSAMSWCLLGFIASTLWVRSQED
jgi:cobalt transporter subunit CbtA